MDFNGKKDSVSWLQVLENYIKHKNNICKSSFLLEMVNNSSMVHYNSNLIYRKIDNIELSKTMVINKKNIPSTPNTTPLEQLQPLFDENSGWNRLNLIDKLDYQSPGNISNSSNSPLNSSIGDRLSNLHSASPNRPSLKDSGSSSSASASTSTSAGGGKCWV